MSDEKTPPREQRIGQNIDRLRRDADKTQKEVAEYMRAAGFKWSQATVWSVEAGERPVRLSEAYELARLLDIGVSGLLLTKESAVMADHVLGTYRLVEESQEGLTAALRNVRAAIERAGEVVKDTDPDTMKSLANDLPPADMLRVAHARGQLYVYADQGIKVALSTSLEQLGIGGIE